MVAHSHAHSQPPSPPSSRSTIHGPVNISSAGRAVIHYIPAGVMSWRQGLRHTENLYLWQGLGFSLCAAPPGVYCPQILGEGVSALCTYFHTMLPLEHGIL